MSGFPRYSGPRPETPGCKGINTFYHGQKIPFILLYSLIAPLLSLSPPFLPIQTLGRFPLSTGQI
jgi:hypothetical protein